MSPVGNSCRAAARMTSSFFLESVLGSRLRVYGGTEVDFILSSRDLLVALEAKGGRGHPGPVHSLRRIVGELRLPGTKKDARRLCLIVHRGREVTRMDPGVWAVPFQRLFSPV